MKILYLHGYYELPEDFNGTLEDALISYIEYRKSNGYVGNTCGILTEPRDNMTNEELWEKFLTKDSKFKAVMGVSVSEFKNGEFKYVKLSSRKDL